MSERQLEEIPRTSTDMGAASYRPNAHLSPAGLGRILEPRGGGGDAQSGKKTAMYWPAAGSARLNS